MLKHMSLRLFSKQSAQQGQATKLSHVRLNLKDFNQKLPLIKQNVLNRKAGSYANPELVNHLYEEYRKLKHDIDQLRKKRNEHAAAIKNVLHIEDDQHREKLLEAHHKVGKTFKTDLQQREKDFEELEYQLIVRAALQ
jgi:seryl-tRNA synthetase